MEALFFLGEKLGKTVRELAELEYSEFVLWTRYFARKAQAQELATKRTGG